MKELFLHSKEAGYRYESEILYDKNGHLNGWVISEIDSNHHRHEVRFNRNGNVVSELWTEPWGYSEEKEKQPVLLIEYDENGSMKRKILWELQQEEGLGTDWNYVEYDAQGKIIIDTRW